MAEHATPTIRDEITADRMFVEHDRAERAQLCAMLDEVLARLHDLERQIEAVRLELDDTQPEDLV